MQQKPLPSLKMKLSNPTPLEDAKAREYGVGLMVDLSQSSYDQGLKNLQRTLHDLVDEVDRRIADKSLTPCERTEHIAHIIPEALSNCHLSQLFREARTLDVAIHDKKRAKEAVTRLEAEKAV